MNTHLHRFEIECDFSGIHVHCLKGYVKNTLGIRRLHFHFYYGVSSYLGHAHYYSGITGKPIETENGHIHRLSGILEKADGHTHRFDGYTYEDTAYIPGAQTVGHQI